MERITEKAHLVTVDVGDAVYFLFTVDGLGYRIRWVDCSPRLAQATQVQRQFVEVSPSGYGLHWPMIDEDLAVDPLVEQAEMVKRDGR